MKKLFILISAFLCFLHLGNAQNFDWVTQIPGLSEELSRDMVRGTNGDAYVCGTFGNTMILPSGTITSTGFRDGFLFKFDDNGNLLWHTLMTSSSSCQPIAMGIDSQEHIYVLVEVGDTMRIQGNALAINATPYLVVEFDSAGQYLSHFEPITNFGQGAGFGFAGMSVSPGGRISLAGTYGVFVPNSQSITIGGQTFSLPVNPNNGFRIPQGFTAQFRPDGTLLWADLTNGRGNSFISHLGAAPDGGVVVCGAFGPQSGGSNSVFDFGPGTPSLSTDFGSAGFVARYDSSGNVLWAQAMQPGNPFVSQFTQAEARKLAVDPTGAVYIYGEYIETVRWGSDSVNAFPTPFFGGVGFYGYLAKASPAGTPLWIHGISFEDNGNAQVNAMAADSANVFLGGEYSDTLLIGGLGLFSGSSDIWFASLDGSNAQGNYLQGVNAPGFPDEVNGLAVQENGRLYLTGTIDPPANFGPFAITDPPNSCCSNFFLAGYGVGCAGPSVRFTADSAGVYLMNFFNQTTFSGAVTYQWDFGDGNTSIANNPAHTFPGPGFYPVTLTATDSCGVDSFFLNVLVPCQPGDSTTANFTLDNDTTNLTITVITNSPNATDAFWTFGDGNTSTAFNPSHQYNQPGTYDVCLVTQNFCNLDTLCQQVEAKCDTSEIGFTFDSDTTNLTITFTDQSVNVDGYLWSFGDGNTSNLPNPMHQYNFPGTYTVCLITQGLCDIDTLCQVVEARCDTSEIGFTFTSDTTNLTITFTDQSVNVEDYLWSFGDGNSSTLPSPVHQYNQPGTYTVCLITRGPCDIDTLCQVVEARCDTSEIGFTFDSDTTNATITFTDQSVNVEDYLWSFGDGRTDTVASPVHQYNQPGTYTVCLITRGPCDIDTLCQVVEAQCDTSEIGFIFDSDTTNLTVTFTDQSVNVEDYLWSFGDGRTDTVASPVHQYIQPGTYTVCLITRGPCDIDTLCQNVVADCDTTAIGFVVDDISPSGEASILNTTVNAESYLWSFGDGGTSTEENPTHQYQPGTYTLCLIALGPCDIDTLCETVEVGPTSVLSPRALTFKVYPNPAQDHVKLAWTGALPADHVVQWYNSLGQKIGSEILTTGREGNLIISLARQPSGTYVLRVSSPDTEEFMRIQKLE